MDVEITGNCRDDLDKV